MGDAAFEPQSLKKMVVPSFVVIVGMVASGFIGCEASAPSDNTGHALRSHEERRIVSSCRLLACGRAVPPSPALHRQSSPSRPALAAGARSPRTLSLR